MVLQVFWIISGKSLTFLWNILTFYNIFSKFLNHTRWAGLSWKKNNNNKRFLTFCVLKINPLVICPPGRYSKDGLGPFCKFCSNGTYQDKPQRTSCLPCPQGTYTLHIGATFCGSKLQESQVTIQLNLPTTLVFVDRRGQDKGISGHRVGWVNGSGKGGHRVGWVNGGGKGGGKGGVSEWGLEGGL